MKLMREQKAESNEKDINRRNPDRRNFLRAGTVAAGVAGSLSPAELNTVGAFGNASWLSLR